LFLECPDHVAVTASTAFEIRAGIYAYVGSCGLSCLKRLARHLARPASRRWHVDYLNCKALYAIITPLAESELAGLLAGSCEYVPGFGSTDDRHAPSHLFRCDLPGILRALRSFYPAHAPP
jgi:Uri superfamily endonuclease